MEKDNPKTAIIVSALTFGLGHIVNLFNGSGQDITATIIQIVFCRLSWFCAGAVFYYSGSLIHPVPFGNNALSAFEAREPWILNWKWRLTWRL